MDKTYEIPEKALAALQAMTDRIDELTAGRVNFVVGLLAGLSGELVAPNRLKLDLPKRSVTVLGQGEDTEETELEVGVSSGPITEDEEES